MLGPSFLGVSNGYVTFLGFFYDGACQDFALGLEKIG
jgi:hypothetical protein